jgi:hypothetical protein
MASFFLKKKPPKNTRPAKLISISSSLKFTIKITLEDKYVFEKKKNQHNNNKERRKENTLKPKTERKP